MFKKSQKSKKKGQATFSGRKRTVSGKKKGQATFSGKKRTVSARGQIIQKK